MWEILHKSKFKEERLVLLAVSGFRCKVSMIYCFGLKVGKAENQGMRRVWQRTPNGSQGVETKEGTSIDTSSNYASCFPALSNGAIVSPSNRSGPLASSYFPKVHPLQSSPQIMSLWRAFHIQVIITSSLLLSIWFRVDLFLWLFDLLREYSV